MYPTETESKHNIQERLLAIQKNNEKDITIYWNDTGVNSYRIFNQREFF